MIRAGIFGALVAVALHAYAAIAQTPVYVFGPLTYSFPSSHAAGQLKNDGSGTLTWSNDAPTGLVLYSTSGSCPSGWTEYTTGRGRYFVGLVASGTNEGTSGTALTDQENRPTGQHNHTGSTTVTITGTHTHTLVDPGHVHGGTAVDVGGGILSDLFQDRLTGTGGSSTNVTGITIDSVTTGVTVTADTLAVANTGATTGTNAPYVQLIACEKT